MFLRLIGLTVIILLLQTGHVHAEDINPVVGKAGDFVLREADLDRLIGYQSPDVQKTIQSNPEQKNSFIRQVLITKALASKARKDGFEKKPDTREIISFLIDQYLGREYLEKVVAANVTVSDEEMKKYYAEHEEEFLVPESIKVSHIFIAVPANATPEEKEKAKAKAKDLLEKVKKGGDFAKIAMESSEDEDSASKGGNLGYISAGKTNSPEFEKAIFALKPGEISDIIETSFGFHIAKVEEKREKRKASFDEVKEYIHGQLKEQNKQKRMKEFLDNLVKDSQLEIVGEKSAVSK